VSQTAHVKAICALLGYYTALSGGYVPTFRHDLSVPSSREKKSDFLYLEDGFLNLFVLCKTQLFPSSGWKVGRHVRNHWSSDGSYGPSEVDASLLSYLRTEAEQCPETLRSEESSCGL
jgi:hypothetical protein